MSFHKNMNNSNNQNELEQDDMNIKSQLNTSLDLQGIRVTDDLINRTLEAVKKQESGLKKAEAIKTAGNGVSEGKHPDTGKKTGMLILWSKYARIIAGAAAAVFVVAVGLNAIGGMNNSQKDMSSSLVAEEKSAGGTADSSAAVTPAAMDGSTSMQYDSDSSQSNTEKQPSKEPKAIKQSGLAKDNKEVTKEQESTSYSANDETGSISGTSVTKATDADTDNTAPKDNVSNTDTDSGNKGKVFGVKASIAGDTPTPEDTASEEEIAASKKVAGGGGTTDNSDKSADITAAPNLSFNANYLKFINIFLSGPEKAEYIKITNDAEQSSITLTDQEDIKNFYLIMDQYLFTVGTAAPTTMNYTIEAVSKQTSGESYTMKIGDNISIDYVFGDTASDSYYHTTDTDQLLTDLETFLRKYSQTN